MSKFKKIIIYTDGACFQNPGPGGYGAVLLYDTHRKELSGGFRLTTNNRMEIMAAIVSLEALKFACDVTLYTDAQYLAESMMKGWVLRWRRNGWMKSSRKKARNHDLWERLLEVCAKHKVAFRWLRGHAGHPENERCDKLAAAASQRAGLPAGEAYEREQGTLSVVPLFAVKAQASSSDKDSEKYCASCGTAIPMERLEVIPDASRCVACQKLKELEPATAED